MKWLFFIFCCVAVHADLVRQVEAHLTIGDAEMAVRLARHGMRTSPSPELQDVLILACAQKGVDREALRLLHLYEKDDSKLLEAVAWSTIKKGAASSAQMHRLAAMIGAVTTRDVQAVSILTGALQSDRPLLRRTALQLAPMLRDAPIKHEVARLLQNESNWEVRLAAISAAGGLLMLGAKDELENIAGSVEATAEERWSAIRAIVNITEEASSLNRLATDPRAGLRQLACEVIAHLELDEADIIYKLLGDPRPDVRISALCTFGLLRPDIPLDRIRPLLSDPNESVQITAAWLITLYQPKEGQALLYKWLQTESTEGRRLAAAAIAKTGKHGIALAKQMLHHPDPYVQGMLAIGLLGQREQIEEASEILYRLITTHEERWMFQNRHPLFRTLCPSTVRHSPVVPNAPEVADQLTRLEVLHMLAVVEHPKAEQAIRQFLGESSWGVTGVAAITLLAEGDEAELDLIRKLLTDDDDTVRVQAALALAIWGKDPSAVTVLEKAYPTADRDLKLKILEATGHIGSIDSIPFLLEAMEEPFETLRILAASSLIQCLNA